MTKALRYNGPAGLFVDPDLEILWKPGYVREVPDDAVDRFLALGSDDFSVEEPEETAAPIVLTTDPVTAEFNVDESTSQADASAQAGGSEGGHVALDA